MLYDKDHLARIFAEQGRSTDTELAHLTPGEIVIPGEIIEKNPQLRRIIEEIFDNAGMDLDRYRVSSGKNSINPTTGAQEFYGSDAERGFEEAQGQFGGAQGNEPGYGGNKGVDGGGSTGSMSASQYNSALADKTYGGMSKSQFEATYGPPATGGLGPGGAGGVSTYGGDRNVGDDDFGGFSNTDPDPSADPRGTQTQRGLYNSGAGKGGIPDKDVIDHILEFFGGTRNYDEKKDPNTGKTVPYQYDKHWGYEFNPIGTAVGLATGPLGLLAGPLAGKAAKALGAPTLGISKNGVAVNPGIWGETWGNVSTSPGSTLSDDGGPEVYDIPGTTPLAQQIQQAFTPPAIPEPPSWLGDDFAGMNDLQKRSYLMTNALYGNNSAYRADDIYDLWSGLARNNAYSANGELRALDDFLLPTERTYLTNVRGMNRPSRTSDLLNMISTTY